MDTFTHGELPVPFREPWNGWGLQVTGMGAVEADSKERPKMGVPVVAHRLIKNPTGIHEDVDPWAPLSELRIWHFYKLQWRSQSSSDLVLLWLWRRPAAAAPI